MDNLYHYRIPSSRLVGKHGECPVFDDDLLIRNQVKGDWYSAQFIPTIGDLKRIVRFAVRAALESEE